MGAYAASKAGVMRLTGTMAAELREQGINVNAVPPTIIDTPQNRADMPGADPAKWWRRRRWRTCCSRRTRHAAVHGALGTRDGVS